MGKKRYDELPNLLAKADIGVALFRVNDLMKYTFPLKVVEYMAAGLAVVGTRVGETERLWKRRVARRWIVLLTRLPRLSLVC